MQNSSKNQILWMSNNQAFLLLGNICCFDKGDEKSESEHSPHSLAYGFSLPSNVKGFL